MVHRDVEPTDSTFRVFIPTYLQLLFIFPPIKIAVIFQVSLFTCHRLLRCLMVIVISVLVVLVICFVRFTCCATPMCQDLMTSFQDISISQAVLLTLRSTTPQFRSPKSNVLNLLQNQYQYKTSNPFFTKRTRITYCRPRPIFTNTNRTAIFFTTCLAAHQVGSPSPALVSPAFVTLPALANLPSPDTHISLAGPPAAYTYTPGQPNNYREKMAAYGVHDPSALTTKYQDERVLDSATEKKDHAEQVQVREEDGGEVSDGGEKIV